MQCAKRKSAISVDFQRKQNVSFNNQGKNTFFFFRQTKIESLTTKRSLPRKISKIHYRGKILDISKYWLNLKVI